MDSPKPYDYFQNIKFNVCYYHEHFCLLNRICPNMKWLYTDKHSNNTAIHASRRDRERVGLQLGCSHYRQHTSCEDERGQVLAVNEKFLFPRRGQRRTFHVSFVQLLPRGPEVNDAVGIRFAIGITGDQVHCTMD